MDIGYWDSFYRDGGPNRLHASFSEVVKGHFRTPGFLIEFGCGDGSDAVYFAESGWRVHASDASVEGVKLAQRKKEKRGLGEKLVVLQCEVATDTFPEEIGEALQEAGQSGIGVVFTRFFLHSLDDQELEGFVRNLAEAVPASIFMAHEFRVPADENLSKLFSGHRRFFRTPQQVIEVFSRYFEVLTFSCVESDSVAVFREENPVVGRLICKIQRRE